jgi:hypothetical protein
LANHQSQWAVKGGHFDVRFTGAGWPATQRKAGPAELPFVAFVVIITVIAVMLTLTKIYLQNPG